LEEKDGIIRNLEEEIVTLRKKLQQKNMQNSSKVLDKIINNQRPHHDKFGLGYNQTKTTYQETLPRSYVDTLRGDKNFYNEDHREISPTRIFRFHND